MVTPEEQPKSPSERLAGGVARALLARGFITADKLDEVTRSVASGAAGTADWRLWIEMAKEKQQDGHDGSA